MFIKRRFPFKITVWNQWTCLTMTSSLQKKKTFQVRHTSTRHNGANRWKPQVSDWPLYWISCLVALSDNAVVTLTAQVKPETDDKHRHSKQSHVVPLGLARPGNSTPALPMAPALNATQHHSSTAHCCPVNTLTADPVRKLTPQNPF